MVKENKVNLLEGNLSRTIIKLGYPMAIASVVQTLYNLADSFWLGKLGRNALAAPIISFNIIFFILSLGMGFSIAGTSLVSQYTGSGEKEKANKVAGNLLCYLILFSVFFVFVGLFFDRSFLSSLSTPEDTFALTLSYYRIMVIGMPLAFPFFVYQSVMNGYGDTISPLKIQIISAIINLILDPLLIFGSFGFPRMGVKGAALTTIITRGLASLVGIYYFFSGTKGIKLTLKHLKPDFKLFPLMFKIGAPSSIGMSGGSLGFLVLISIVNQFGTPVISAYGICNRVIHFFMMPAMGISAAITAIVGQNLGANNLRRAKDVVKKGVYLILIVIVPSMILTALFGKYITIFFIPKDPLVHQIGNVMFYIVSPSVIFFALTSVFNGAFQGAGFTIPVMVTNLARIWVFRIPLVYFFSFILLNGANDINSSIGIWGGMFFSNLLAFLMILVLYLKGNWTKSRINTK